MLGYSREELLNMSPGDIDTTNNFSELIKKAEQKLLNPLANKQEIIFETEHNTAEGKTISIELNASIICTMEKIICSL